MDALSQKKNLIVVVNSILMDNHQEELAYALQSKFYLLNAKTPNELLRTFQTANWDRIVPYPPINTAAFPRIVSEMTKKKITSKILVVLGSGGHTTEMLKLIQDIPCTFEITYVLGSSDHTSIERVCKTQRCYPSQFHTIPRSREVGQSWISCIFTTLYSILACFPILYEASPDLVVCNGPGTCIPICIIVCFFRCFSIHTRIVFIESLARVNECSLSGKIAYYLSDRFIVHWTQLEKKYVYMYTKDICINNNTTLYRYPHAEYIGVIG